MGLKDWHQLKEYHDSGSDQKTSETPFAGATLMTPSQEEVYEMNGEDPPLDPVEEEKDAEQKQKEEKKKEEEEKKQDELSKGEHDGKYFVVHGAKCVCDKAVNPKQTADLQVTSDKSIVLNDQQKKYLATEDDKTFIPPAATFGLCKLQPIPGGGYKPCSLTPAPKWGKTYESTQVLGKKTLTEISELKCMIGGKITIFKHGQTDSVSNAHADNTDPLELAAMNPAIEQPKKKIEYPVVTSIAVTEVEDREKFKEKDSSVKEIIYLRKDEQATFRANLKSGNKQLTSWMVYSDHQGSKENRLLLREQIGTEFSQSFGDVGKYRVEGYVKPKTPEFEKGKYDKCDPSCSIDIEVVENKLKDLGITSNEYSSRIDPSKKLKFRKGVPTIVRAEFFIPRLTEEEKVRLTMHVEDGAGNTISDSTKEVTSITFTPKNSNATYTVKAKYTTESGEVIEKQISGESEGNVVLGIKRIAEIVNPENEVVRPGTTMTFQVSKMRYGFLPDDPDYNITSEESLEIKWNLDGIFIGIGNSITIPGNQLMTPKKYVVEAYSKTANATGKGAKNEEDDWHFEVKENDVLSFKLSGNPKVGKPITATVDKMVFADLLPNEIIHWSAPMLKGTGKSIKVTPKVAGKFNVTCKINSEEGISKDIEILVAKITKGFWNDFGGSEISQASWGQKVDFCVQGENLEGEEIELAIYDSDNVSGDDFGYTGTIKGSKDKNFASHRIELNPPINEKTTNILSSEVKLYGKAKLIGFENNKLKDITPLEKTSKYLTVNNDKTVYRAIIGDKDGRKRYNPVDYDMKSFVYANTTYPKGTKLTVKIFEKLSWREKDKEATELKNAGTVLEDGTLVTEVDWGKLRDAKQNKKTKTYYPEIFDSENIMLLDGSESNSLSIVPLIPQSILKKEVSYVGAVTAGGEGVQLQNNENGICECEAKVRAFMRMLRVKEGTSGEIGYTTQYSGKQFSDMTKHPQEVIKAGNHSSSAAGAYQIMADTWKNLTGNFQDKNKKWFYSEKADKAKQFAIKSFDQESQDKFCLVILKFNYLDDRSDSFYNPTVWKNKDKTIHDFVKEAKSKEWRKRFKEQNGDIIKMIIDDDIKKATLVSSLAWASLPDSPYGQQSANYTFEMVKTIYDKFLKEELIASDPELHLKKGFLNEFGYSCCGNENIHANPELSICPEDRSQCYDYSDVVTSPIINNQSGNKNHNRYHNEKRSTGKSHDGVDILAVAGTEVYAMMCGEVVHVRTDLPQDEINKGRLSKGYESGSYGNTITIMSNDKSGNIVYLFYAHLSKVNVVIGQKVKHGGTIGLSGSTGNAMAVDIINRHVHMEAGTSFSTAGGKDGKLRAKLGGTMNAEKFMKTKFDKKGNVTP